MFEDISPKTTQLLNAIEDEALREDIMKIFASKPALYAPSSVEVLERVRFAVVKIALQGPRMLQLAAKLYVEDTRDLLVSAQFASDQYAHEAWFASVLRNIET